MSCLMPTVRAGALEEVASELSPERPAGQGETLGWAQEPSGAAQGGHGEALGWWELGVPAGEEAGRHLGLG